MPSCKVDELHGWFQNIVTSTGHIADATSIPDDQEEMTVPCKKFKEWVNSIETLKSAFSDVKSEEYKIQEEDTRNRLVFQKLCGLVNKYGFTIAPDRLKGFTLPVTEFG